MRQLDDPFDLNSSPELLRLAEEVRASRKPRALQRDGEVLAILLPASGQGSRRLKRRELSSADLDDFRAAAGSWAGIDLDAFLVDTYAARDALDERPPVNL